MAKPTLVLAGSSEGGPTLEDLVAMFKRLTGRDPSPEDIARVRAKMAAKK